MTMTDPRAAYAQARQTLIDEIREHGHAITGSYVGRQALVLTTTGARTGEPRTSPVAYSLDGDRYVIVASKGGAPEHPGWYRNMLANPEVEVQVGTLKTKARARTVTGEERARLWQQALEFWPPYADYALKTEREIPVVVLDPIG